MAKVTGWAMLSEYVRERGGPRKRREPAEVVYLVAFLGTPVSELALIMSMEREALLDAVECGTALTPGESMRMAMWLGAAWWRYAWRMGNEDARQPVSVLEAVQYVSHLAFVPEDFARDLSTARWAAKV